MKVKSWNTSETYFNTQNVFCPFSPLVLFQCEGRWCSAKESKASEEERKGKLRGFYSTQRQLLVSIAAKPLAVAPISDWPGHTPTSHLKDRSFKNPH